MILITEKQIQNKRPYQEDSMRLFQNEDWIIAIVCDGMGGHAYGKEASNDAANFALSQLLTQSQLSTSIGDVFSSFFGAYDWLSHVPKGFTTYVSIIIHKSTMKARIEHLGDSSVFFLKKENQSIKPMTVPHVSAFGGISMYVPDYTKPYVSHFDLDDLKDSKILVFSDGLDPAFKGVSFDFSKGLDQNFIKAPFDYESSLEDLFEIALQNGSSDNISAYMIEIKNEEVL
jgi:serine/threonine protein phosphatase PrpC